MCWADPSDPRVKVTVGPQSPHFVVFALDEEVLSDRKYRPWRDEIREKRD